MTIAMTRVPTFPTAKASSAFPRRSRRWRRAPTPFSSASRPRTGETLERMKGVVATHLDRFAFREALLPFNWSAREG